MLIEEKCQNIRILLTDVDGVLTDGSIIYGSDGLELKAFNVKDGYICKYLLKSNIKLGIITGRISEAVKKRGAELGFEYVHQGVKDKKPLLTSILNENKITIDQVAYIGDDLNDIEILEGVGLSATPNDAFDYIKNKVDYVCDRSGGKGAFREFADLILTYRNGNT